MRNAGTRPSDFDRETRTGWTLWFTGLPCAGKSTLSRAVEAELKRRDFQTEILDADVLRTTICKDLHFSREDRDANVERIGWACRMLNRHGVIAIAAVISPYRNARAKLRESIPGFIEVYVKTPLAVCIRRDVKGMYAKAMTGEIAHFTGLHDPYEEPLDPDIVVETENQSIICCVNLILKFLHDKGLMVGNVVVAEDS